MSAHQNSANCPAVHWQQVDTVLLDMDGTLLDLRFDNYFWLELVPQRFAVRHGMELAHARRWLTLRFAAKQGTLDWYCLDYWTRELDLDIARLKHEARAQIRFLPGAQHFLAQLHGQVARVALVTNAHLASLAVKARHTGLTDYFDVVISSHQYGVPKEHPQFWRELEADLGFDRQAVLFVDDSLSVLRAAQRHGIGQVIAVSKPDSSQSERTIAGFCSVPAVIDLVAHGAIAGAT